MARGRMLMLAAGARMGQAAAEQRMAQEQQQAAEVDAARKEGAAQAAAGGAAAPAPSSGGNVTAELQKLTDLHTSGALTDEEFAAAKKKLLG